MNEPNPKKDFPFRTTIMILGNSLSIFYVFLRQMLHDMGRDHAVERFIALPEIMMHKKQPPHIPNLPEIV